jgi:hypothetical protein
VKSLCATLLIATLTLEAQQQFRLPAPKPLSNRLSTSKAQIVPAMLTLEQLLATVNKNFPPLRAALLERPLAQADLLNQEGRFDLSLRSRVDSQNFGFYQNERFEISLEQPTQMWGSTLYSGYGISRGRYPDYDGKAVTNEAGQYRAGIRATAKSTAGVPISARPVSACVWPIFRSISSASPSCKPQPAVTGIGLLLAAAS